jgi:phage tail protein X
MLATARYIPYVTVAGDRWDTVAWRFYGDATVITPIVMANPTVAVMAVFDAGINIAIPILAYNAAQSTANLPPWRRT